MPTQDWSEFIPPERQEAVELAGRWKHGWIPLDATAVSSKMKGNTGGKKWWSGNKSGRAVGVPKKGTKSRREGLGDTAASQAQVRKGGPAVPGSGRIHAAENGKRITAKMTPSEAAERGLARKSGSMLTSKEAPGAGFKKRPANRASKASYQNGKIGTMNEKPAFGAQATKNQVRKHQAAAARGQGSSLTKDLPKDYKAEGLQASKDAQARIAARRAASGDKPHPLTRSRKPISQMSARERTDEANRADKMAERQPDRSAEWKALARLLRGKSGKA